MLRPLKLFHRPSEGDLADAYLKLRAIEKVLQKQYSTHACISFRGCSFSENDHSFFVVRNHFANVQNGKNGKQRINV